MKAIKKEVNDAGVIIVERLPKTNGNQRLLCLCPNCGHTFVTWASGFYLNRNSCGCNHPKSKRLYGIWINMKTRCYNPNFYGAKYYSLKSITICDEWRHDYKNFEKWAFENGYSESLTIDRIDGSKGYCPENCRWADAYVQNRNKSNNINITIDGVTKNIKDWCRYFGIKYKTAMSFLYRYGKDEMPTYFKGKGATSMRYSRIATK